MARGGGFRSEGKTGGWGGLLEFAQGGGEDGGEREFAWAGEEEAEREEEFGESVLHALIGEVVAVRQMDHEDCAEHDDDTAGGADAKERSEKNGNAARELCQANKVADDCGGVHKSGEVTRAGTAKSAKEDCRAVIDERKRAS